ncbi:MAG: pirin family protein [Steroidobacteraceae bacterium]
MRQLQRVIPASRTSDGAGVSLYRSLGKNPHTRLDPFLMLDEFGSDRPDEYIAGFPPHPHRGFETVTYMLEGHMLHEDHLGNRGDLKSGGVQWMTAGRGIIHSEMPQQESGLMRGFQLWINLPAAEKMKPAGYRDIDASELPEATFEDGTWVKVVAGMVEREGRSLSGPIQGLTTDPLFMDIRLPAGKRFEQPIKAGHQAYLYVFEGELSASAGTSLERALPARHGGCLGGDGPVVVEAGESGARFLLLAARPLGEPIVQYGPFVMNTRAELEQAVADYQAGRLTG